MGHPATFRRAAMLGLLLIAAGRLALSLYSGSIFVRPNGDFETNLPAGYLADRPSMGDFPDLADPQWQMETYPRGPSEYLTILPLALARSYYQISQFLLVAYGVVIVATALLCWRTVVAAAGREVAAVPIIASTLCFAPLLFASEKREFELMIVLAFAGAAWAVVSNRQGVFGALIAYASLFKYLPLIVVPYLFARRWLRAIGGFVIAAAALLMAAHLLFGLGRFVNNRVPDMATSRLSGFTSAAQFCITPAQVRDDFAPDDSDRSVRVDLCRASSYLPIAPHVAYVVLILSIGGIAIAGFWRFEAATHVSAVSERWRRVIELSLLIVISTTFVFSHYYYFALLGVPVNIALGRLMTGSRSPAMWTSWAVSYFTLGMFLVPAFVIDRLFQQSLVDIYDATPARLIGVLLLTGVLLYQYVTLPLGADARSAAAAG